MSPDRRRPASLHRGPIPDREPMPDPNQRTVVVRMSVGQPYVLTMPASTARETVENLSDHWDGVSSVSAPRILDADGRGFMLNPAHIVSVDVR